MDTPVKVGDYVTWSHGDRSQIAQVVWVSHLGRQLTVHISEGVYELLYSDEVEVITPNVTTGNALVIDWSK